MSDSEKHLELVTAAATAAATAANVAAEAVTVARDVASRAAETAMEVAKLAQETSKSVLLFAQDMNYIKSDIKEIKEKLDDKYVTKEEFAPVMKISYGLVAVIVLTCVAKLMRLI